MRSCIAHIRRAIGVGRLATALLIVGLAPGWARADAVRYHGYRLSVPSSWSVIDLARTPAACVRFNRHALYLGTPSAAQRCPAHAVGRTEAILVQPIAAGVSRLGTPGGPAGPTTGAADSYVVPSAGVRVTATWFRDRALVSRILAHRLTAPASRQTFSPAMSGVTRSPKASGKPRATPADAVYTGLGFDACSAPSLKTMSAWSSSPYRAVGVYVGGPNQACSQPNLDAAWVNDEVSAGWHLLPIYVGLQGGGSACGCADISSSRASSEGKLDASTAVTDAQAVGIPAGNPIYDDMEQYTRSATNSAAVLAYLSAWTTQLHADGYLSGVYGGASSGITDLVNDYGTEYAEPDDIWIAHWNNEQTTSDAYVPSSEWADHQRIHQYDGAHNETYGGVRLNIDGDYLDGATADTASPIPDGTFVQVTGQAAVYRIAGGAPLYVSSWTAFDGQQPVSTISAQVFDELRPYPVNGTFLTTTTGGVYRVAGGAPFSVTNWALFGGPQPTVTVDQWDLTNVSNPLSHLCSAPANGTVVEGLPSDSYWSFASGSRSPAASTPDALTVDDNGLAAFPVAPQTDSAPCVTPTTQPAPVKCVVPELKRMSLVQARRALSQDHCQVGTVRRPEHWSRGHLLRVFGQSVPAHSTHPDRFKVNLRLT